MLALCPAPAMLPPPTQPLPPPPFTAAAEANVLGGGAAPTRARGSSGTAAARECARLAACTNGSASPAATAAASAAAEVSGAPTLAASASLICASPIEPMLRLAAFVASTPDTASRVAADSVGATMRFAFLAPSGGAAAPTVTRALVPTSLECSRPRYDTHPDNSWPRRSAYVTGAAWPSSLSRLTGSSDGS
jgi:hypothetical protein